MADLNAEQFLTPLPEDEIPESKKYVSPKMPTIKDINWYLLDLWED